jgi:Flp pilus assembly secretin CpaC
LTEDDLVDATEIEVEVTNAEVILNGVVPEREARRRAEDIIDAISGVQHVQNNLRVKNQNPSMEKGREQDKSTERNSAGTAGTRNVEIM